MHLTVSLSTIAIATRENRLEKQPFTSLEKDFLWRIGSVFNITAEGQVHSELWANTLPGVEWRACLLLGKWLICANVLDFNNLFWCSLSSFDPSTIILAKVTPNALIFSRSWIMNCKIHARNWEIWRWNTVAVTRCWDARPLNLNAALNERRDLKRNLK